MSDDPKIAMFPGVKSPPNVDVIRDADHDAMASIAFNLARNVIESDPEQVLRVLQGIERQAETSLPGYTELPEEAKEIIMATFFYLVAIRLREAQPMLEHEIARHMETCKNHTIHKLAVRIGAQGAETHTTLRR